MPKGMGLGLHSALAVLAHVVKFGWKVTEGGVVSSFPAGDKNLSSPMEGLE